jgi:hypothetical protein
MNIKRDNIHQSPEPSKSPIAPTTDNTNMIIPTQIIVKSNTKVLCQDTCGMISSPIKRGGRGPNKCYLWIGSIMNFAGFNIRRLPSRDHLNILRSSRIHSESKFFGWLCLICRLSVMSSMNKEEQRNTSQKWD